MCDPIVLDTKYEFITVLYLFFGKKEAKEKKYVLPANSLTNPSAKSKSITFFDIFKWKFRYAFKEFKQYFFDKKETKRKIATCESDSETNPLLSEAFLFGKI